MRAKSIVLIAFILGVFILAWPLSQAAGEDIGYVKTVIGVFGLLFLASAWTRGKSLDKAAIDIAMGIVGSPREKRQPTGGASSTFAPPPNSGPLPPFEPTPPRKGKPILPPERNRGIFLFRKPRSEGDVTRIGTSWIGGLPALGQVEWPRDAKGRLMHHVMQIDLLEAGPFLNVPGLPNAGSLAVFCALGGEDTTFETTVCLVPGLESETQPPEPLGPIGDHTYGGHYRKGEDPERLGTLPRWAIDLVPVETSGDLETLSAEVSAVRPLGREQHIGVRNFGAFFPNGQRPSFWHSAQIFARSFEHAVASEQALRNFTNMAAKAKSTLATYHAEGIPKRADPQRIRDHVDLCDSRVDRLHAAKPELERLASELMDWAFAHDPWDIIEVADLSQMETYLAKLNSDGSDAHLCYRSSGFYSMDDIANTTLKTMVTGPDSVFRILPDEVRQAVDAQFLSPGMPHQMFGPPGDIQGTAYEFADDHLLVQIVHDDLIGLHLGDGGHIQVWISPDALAKGKLGAAVSTFEGH